VIEISVKIIIYERYPKNLRSDQEKEFYNVVTKTHKNDIHRYLILNDACYRRTELCIKYVERFILKEIKWINLLPYLVESETMNYNIRKH
jgi:hypothetical protein